MKYYELTNEPYFAYTPEQIGFVYKAMSAAAKKADPDCIVGVNTDYRIYVDEKDQYVTDRPQYLPELVKAHGLDYTDVITAHFYNNNLAFYLPWGEHLKKYNKPGWNSETGPTPPSFYKTLPTVESVEQGAAWWSKTQRPDIIQYTDIMEKNLLFTISAGQMQKYFYYFSRFGNCSPSEPTKRAVVAARRMSNLTAGYARVPSRSRLFPTSLMGVSTHRTGRKMGVSICICSTTAPARRGTCMPPASSPRRWC